MSLYSFKGTKRLWAPKADEENHQKALAQESNRIVTPELTMQTPTAESTNKWSLNIVILLLRLYGAHENLWNTRNRDFRNRKLRTAALIDIMAAISPYFANKLTIAEIVQKINVLRATYRYETRRIKNRLRKGFGATTKLKWFALADSFLRHVPKIAKVRRKNEKTDSESDLEHEMVLTIDPAAFLPYENEQIDDSNKAVCSSSESCHQISRVFKGLTANETHRTANKYKWSSKDSLKFVHLLRDQPALWAENAEKDTEEEESKAIQLIATNMGISSFDVKRKIKTFKETYNAENSKLDSCPNHTPAYAWWRLAESFMPGKANLIDFVDANAAIPATPLCENLPALLTPINPSTSVATVDEHDLNNYEAVDSPTDSSQSVQQNKSICIALEDDLLEGKWSLKHSVKFLRLYGAHRCLWDLNSPEYRCRELRAAAIEDIAAVMGHGLTSDYVAKKIKIFRITYMQHRKRMLAATKAGQEPDIQLRWFPLADSFLRPHIGLRSIKEQDLEVPQFNYDYVMANLNLIDPDLLNDFCS